MGGLLGATLFTGALALAGAGWVVCLTAFPAPTAGFAAASWLGRRIAMPKAERLARAARDAASSGGEQR